MKPCTECRWSRKNIACYAPQNIRFDSRSWVRAAGRIELGDLRHVFCSTHRNVGFVKAIVTGKCGQHARWFEAQRDGTGINVELHWWDIGDKQSNLMMGKFIVGAIHRRDDGTWFGELDLIEESVYLQSQSWTADEAKAALMAAAIEALNAS